MNAKNYSQAQAQKEQTEVITFNFSESNHPIRNVLRENNPWFVAKDVCSVLGIKDHKLATATLETDERGLFKIYPLSGKGGLQNTTIISESGLYALILRSRKPQARAFRKWVTSEVLPDIRKKGYYGLSNKPSNFIDIRDVPFAKEVFNGFNVRVIQYKNQPWYSLVDIHRCIGSQTCITQAAKKLNAKKPLAQKIWLFGATQPAWYTNKLGFQLIVSGSRVFAITNQLKLT